MAAGDTTACSTPTEKGVRWLAFEDGEGRLRGTMSSRDWALDPARALGRLCSTMLYGYGVEPRVIPAALERIRLAEKNGCEISAAAVGDPTGRAPMLVHRLERRPLIVDQELSMSLGRTSLKAEARCLSSLDAATFRAKPTQKMEEFCTWLVADRAAIGELRQSVAA